MKSSIWSRTQDECEVMQISNLMYRRFLIGCVSGAFGRPAGLKPAIRQIRNLRYDREV